ncbi:unnamed protein product [Adineta steineri]|uniref:Uncharacterized protein n=1 Tax=Adineta steineri TaxID=433720 RepID=A0A818Y1J7_9BILA|nr:unnamed protein product [Adineta steineri]CAF0887935.1 unnamed protein product [Adineta steineri]CAF3746247.1 unnamed protein product [Adineta steineri]CAF3914498.1 unnamed protein product [Adineta steineri]
MVYHWSWIFLTECAAKLIIVENKLTEEQLLYFRQYYMINRLPRINELRSISKELNNEDFDFFLDLETWFYCRRMAEEATAQRQYEAKKIAA